MQHVRMGNSQGAWILYVALLTYNFLNADEQKANTPERHWIVEKKSSKLSQPTYLKNVLTAGWESRYMLNQGTGYAFGFHRKQKATNFFKINKYQI